MADPATIAIATAAATGMATVFSEKVSQGTVALVNKLAMALTKRFGQEPEAQQALVAARFEGPEQQQAIATVAEHLERAERDDPEIAELMERLRPLAVQNEGGTVVYNHNTGDIGGQSIMIQAGHIHGGVQRRP
jgi:hypothetical protein